MFPNVYGFHWTAGHLVFLGLFFSAVLTVATTVVLAVIRAFQNARRGKLNHIRWHAEFHDLPERDRVCRHELTGEFSHRTCARAFDCCTCATHAQLVQANPPGAAMDIKPFGLDFPADRLYHRGHTWVREENGELTVGLDDFARRLIGVPDEITLPEPGQYLETNGTAWTFRRNGVEVRVLAPVNGEVASTGGLDAGYYLKLKPATTADTRHLLRGAEIRPWLERELERLQLLISGQEQLPALADGGVLVEDLPRSCPDANWDAVWGELLLHP